MSALWFSVALIATAQDGVASAPAVTSPDALEDLESAPPRVAPAPGDTTAPAPAPAAPGAVAPAGPTSVLDASAALGASALALLCGGTCGLLAGALVPVGIMAFAVTLLAWALNAGTQQGGLGGACLIILGIIYAVLIFIPGYLLLGPMTSSGVTGGVLAGSLFARNLPRRLLGLPARSHGVAGVIDNVALRVLAVVGTFPGLLVGWGAAAGLVVAVAWATNTGQVSPWENGIDPRGWTWAPGWLLAASLAGCVWLGAPIALAGGVALPVLHLVATDFRADLQDR